MVDETPGELDAGEQPDEDSESTSESSGADSESDAGPDAGDLPSDEGETATSDTARSARSAGSTSRTATGRRTVKRRRVSKSTERPSDGQGGRKRAPAARDTDDKKGESRRRPAKERSDSSSESSSKKSSKSDSESKESRDERTRSQMLVHADDDQIHVAILEGRTLVEHNVTHRGAQSIAGNIYLGKVQNVLPGMEAAFIDIGTSKNAVLYAGDVRYVPEEGGSRGPRIEDILSVGQSVLVQVVKDPMGSKGARLTSEISLPGRFLVLVPEDDSTGISRRISDADRNRLRETLRRLRPDGFGVIVRTAAEQASDEQLEADLKRLETLWHEIYITATRSNPPKCIYEEPELVIRTVREAFSADYRRLCVDDADTHAKIVEYLKEFDPDLVDKVSLYEDEMTLFARYHVTDQIRQGLARKVWLPSGGSLVFDYGEALTIIDVNTAKNVGTDSLEQTVYENNLEAAEEIARQLRLRDVGGIIVIDFIDMEIKKNRDAVLRAFKRAVSHDKTKTQIYEISELGLVEMTRKNVSEGLFENFTKVCGECQGLGYVVKEELLA